MDQNPYQSPTSDLTGTNSAANSEVSPRAISELLGTKPWVRFIAVLGFIGAAFMFLGSLGMFAAATQVGAPMAIVGVIYILYGIIFIFPTLKLWKYGSAIGNLQISRSTAHLEEALLQQRVYWKFIGIMIIIGFVLGIVMAIAMASIGAAVSQGAFPMPTDGEPPNFNFE